MVFINSQFVPGIEIFIFYIDRIHTGIELEVIRLSHPDFYRKYGRYICLDLTRDMNPFTSSSCAC